MLSDTLSLKVQPLKAMAWLFLIWKSEKACHDILKMSVVLWNNLLNTFADFPFVYLLNCKDFWRQLLPKQMLSEDIETGRVPARSDTLSFWWQLPKPAERESTEFNALMPPQVDFFVVTHLGFLKESEVFLQHLLFICPHSALNKLIQNMKKKML